MKYVKRDANHGRIANGLLAVGLSVFDAASVGGGFADLVVGGRDISLLIEIKETGHRDDLTGTQKVFRSSWKGSYVIVESLQEALDACANHGLTSGRAIVG